MDQNNFQFHGVAKAKRDDPDTSHAAADEMNANNSEKLNKQQVCVLRALREVNGITAKGLGLWMAKDDIDRFEWPHKRCRELETKGYILRFDSDDSREKVCWITSAGEKYLERL